MSCCNVGTSAAGDGKPVERISPTNAQTQHTHRARLFELFGIKSIVGLVQLGKSWGLRR